MIDDVYIINKYWVNDKLNSNFKKNITKEEFAYLQNRYVDSSGVKETLWRIKYNIKIRPTCVICGKDVEFIGKNNIIYKKCCCKKCLSELKSNNSKNNIIDEEKKNEIVNKRKRTKLLKYGDENYNNRDKAFNTCIEKYGIDIPIKLDEIKKKSKNTFIEKYGVDCPAKLDTNVFKRNNPQKNEYIKQKTKNTNISKYGGPSPTSDKSIYLKQRKTIKEKYGYDCWLNSEEGKEYLKTRIINIKKIKETCIKKYGVDSYSKTQEFKDIIKSLHDDIQNKIYNTKKENNTFNSSIEETKSYIFLSTKYPDIIRQYTSNLYPFNCDFYIPSTDTYIECNFHWTHGDHPFDCNNQDDINKLELWKSKNTKYYDNAIKTWTIRDVNKRNIAKENNLKYIECWDIEDILKL